MSTYDLTGVDPSFLRTDKRFAVFEANQRLYLNEPAFANSIQVTLLDGNTNPVLVPGVQWQTSYQDRDYAAMSEAKLIDANFNSILVKSLENLVIPAQDMIYAVSYQALKLKPSEEDPGEYGPNPTPGLLTELINDVDYLKLVKNPLGDLTSDAVDGIKALTEDVTGVNDDNLIEDERHYVNVPINKMVIRPAAGAFWAHDVVLTNVTTGLPLVADVDYKFIGWNRSKQSIAEHPSAIYDYIFILTPLVGNIDVTYRAFGGEATVSDINAIKDVLAEVSYLLTEGVFLTDQSLPAHTVIVKIIERLNSVEAATRLFINATHQFIAETDGKHWFTIGNLYRDTWDTNTLESGQVHLSLRSWTQIWNYDLIVTMNVRSPGDKLTVKTLASTDKNNAWTIGNYDSIENRKIPEFRAVWIDDGTLSGLQLQIGLEMTALQPEVLSVYDHSGMGSDFVIRPNITGSDVVYDDDVVLPDDRVWVNPYRGSFVNVASLVSAIPTGELGWFAFAEDTGRIWQWDNDINVWHDSTSNIPVGLEESTHKVARNVICPENGYLAWAGAVPLKEVEALTAGLDLVSTIKEGEIQIQNIKRVEVHIYDRRYDRMITKSEFVHFGNDVSHNQESYTSKFIELMFFAEDLCGVSITITDENPVGLPGLYPEINVVSNLGTQSIDNDRFDLRQIVLYF
jgi:hypothetical protein